MRPERTTQLQLFSICTAPSSAAQGTSDCDNASSYQDLQPLADNAQEVGGSIWGSSAAQGTSDWENVSSHQDLQPLADNAQGVGSSNWGSMSSQHDLQSWADNAPPSAAVSGAPMSEGWDCVSYHNDLQPSAADVFQCRHAQPSAAANAHTLWQMEGHGRYTQAGVEVCDPAAAEPPPPSQPTAAELEIAPQSLASVVDVDLRTSPPPDWAQSDTCEYVRRQLPYPHSHDFVQGPRHSAAAMRRENTADADGSRSQPSAAEEEDRTEEIYAEADVHKLASEPGEPAVGGREFMSSQEAAMGAMIAKHRRERLACLLHYAPEEELDRYFADYGQRVEPQPPAPAQQVIYCALEPAPPRNPEAPRNPEPVPFQRLPLAAPVALEETQSAYGCQSDCTVLTATRCFSSFSPPPAQIDHRSTPYRYLFQIDCRSTPDRRQIDHDIRLIVDRPHIGARSTTIPD